MPAPERARLHALLSEDEQARATRFHAPLHRDRYVVAHGRLRELLGVRLEASPSGLRFGLGAHGKPHLEGPEAASGLQFNLSHSGGQGLVGWASGLRLGVDLEIWRTLDDESALVRRYFSAAENAAYDALRPLERTRGFFECWTRKEAYIKAVGRGLGLPLDSFDVSFGAGRKPALLRPSMHAADGGCWTLAAPDTDFGISIAVVLEGDACLVVPAE